MSTESPQPHTVTRHVVVPPTMGPLRRHTHTYDLMRQCIHCGFCLPVCPTYAVLGVEMDSPRGRIYQMRAVAEGKLTLSHDFIEHMDCCVGCRACETACPSGVQFGKLIEAAREHIQLAATSVAAQESSALPTSAASEEQLIPTAATQHGSLATTLLRHFFFERMLPSRGILTLVFGGLKLYQRSGLQKLVHGSGLFAAINNLPTAFKGKLTLPEALMDAARGDIVPRRLPEITPAHGTRRYRVGFVSGCIMDQVFHDINEATLRVLAANGCEVITPPQQHCCGALHIHSGEAEQGRELARLNIAQFEAYHCDAIIINSAGCGSTLKEYAHLLRDDPAYASRAQAFSAQVKDISEFLSSISINQHMGEVKQVVAYHDACHLLHGQKIKQQPRALLKAIPGVTLVDLPEADWCCGSAGIYNLTQQEMAQQLLERKMTHISACGASVIATGNPGCMLQIAMGARQRGLPLEVMHPVQLLDAAYRAGGLYSLPQAHPATTQKQRLMLGAGISLLAILVLLRRRKIR